MAHRHMRRTRNAEALPRVLRPMVESFQAEGLLRSVEADWLVYEVTAYCSSPKRDWGRGKRLPDGSEERPRALPGVAKARRKERDVKVLRTRDRRAALGLPCAKGALSRNLPTGVTASRSTVGRILARAASDAASKAARASLRAGAPTRLLEVVDGAVDEGLPRSMSRADVELYAWRAQPPATRQGLEGRRAALHRHLIAVQACVPGVDVRVAGDRIVVDVAGSEAPAPDASYLPLQPEAAVAYQAAQYGLGPMFSSPEGLLVQHATRLARADEDSARFVARALAAPEDAREVDRAVRQAYAWNRRTNEPKTPWAAVARKVHFLGWTMTAGGSATLRTMCVLAAEYDDSYDAPRVDALAAALEATSWVDRLGRAGRRRWDWLLHVATETSLCGWDHHQERERMGLWRWSPSLPNLDLVDRGCPMGIDTGETYGAMTDARDAPEIASWRAYSEAYWRAKEAEAEAAHDDQGQDEGAMTPEYVFTPDPDEDEPLWLDEAG